MGTLKSEAVFPRDFKMTDCLGVTVDPQFGLEGGEEILDKMLEARTKYWTPTYWRYYDKNYKSCLAKRRGRGKKQANRSPEQLAHDDCVRIAEKFAYEDPQYLAAVSKIEQEYGGKLVDPRKGL